MTKYLILLSGNRDYFSEFNFTDDQWSTVENEADSYTLVIECPHDNLEDNTIYFTNKDSETLSVLMDKDGKLYIYDECYTSTEIMMMFEGESITKILNS